MLTPRWILDTFAAVMLGVAMLSVARLALARPRQSGAVAVGIDLAHLLMSLAMAGTLTTKLAVSGPVLTACFALLTLWFAFQVAKDATGGGVRALAGGHCAPHLVHSAAMLYMSLALTSSAGRTAAGGMGGSSASALGVLGMPTLALGFALALIGYGVRDLDQLSGRRRRPAMGLDGVAVVLDGTAGPMPRVAVPPWESLAAPAAGARELTAGAATALASTAFASTAFAGSPSAGTASAAGHAGGTRAILLSPEVTVACRIAMGVTMALMLLIMI
jgi:hypothetical protein